MEMLVLLSLLDHGILAAEVGKVEDEDQIDSENIDLSPNLNPEVRAYAENPRTEEAKNDDEDLDAKPKAAADQYLCLDEKLTATNKASGDLAKDQTDFENLDLVGNQNPENEVYAEKAENKDEAAKYLSSDEKLKAIDEYQPKAADDEKLTTKKKAAKDLCLDDRPKVDEHLLWMTNRSLKTRFLQRLTCHSLYTSYKKFTEDWISVPESISVKPQDARKQLLRIMSGGWDSTSRLLCEV